MFSRRLERVPAYYAAAKANIEGPTREHTQLAIDQNRGALAVFGPDLEHTLEMSDLSAAERAAFNERLAAARAAIEDYVRWLEALDERLASGAVAARSFRLGGDLYAPKFAFEIQSGDTAEALNARALAEKDVLHTRMRTLAELLWPKYFPNEAAPSDALETIGRVIARLSDEHVAPRGARARGRAANPRARAVGPRPRPARARRVEAARRPRDAAAQARHRGRGHRRAGAVRRRRADVLQRHAARRRARGARRELAARVQPLDAARAEHPRGGSRATTCSSSTRIARRA